MTKKNRAMALLLAVAFVFVMLFSFLFLADNADHHCTQDDCAICQHLEACEQNLQGVALVAVAMALSAFLSRGEEKADVFFVHPGFFHSLVSLKVKLSN